MKALVVDDSAGVRAFLRMVLQDAGVAVVEAKNGIEAVRMLNSGLQADLALLDWNMPEMDGYELLLWIRSNRVFDRLRVVMVTTETEFDQITKALEHGADEYVMKPFTREVIFEKLQIIGMDVAS